jgi:hypothetical protein
LENMVNGKRNPTSTWWSVCTVLGFERFMLEDYRTAPHRTALTQTTPHRTAPHRTAPHRTALHRTAPHLRRPLRTAPLHTALLTCYCYCNLFPDSCCYEPLPQRNTMQAVDDAHASVARH